MAIKNRPVLICILLFSVMSMALAGNVLAQDLDMNKQELSKKALRKHYYLVSYHMERLEYGDALPILKILLKNDEQNANYYYQAGLCLYHMKDYARSKEYLEIAAQKTSNKYKDSVFETNAPAEATYYLELVNKQLNN